MGRLEELVLSRGHSPMAMRVTPSGLLGEQLRLRERVAVTAGLSFSGSRYGDGVSSVDISHPNSTIYHYDKG